MKHDVELKPTDDSEEVMRVFADRSVEKPQMAAWWLLPAAVGGVGLWGLFFAYIFGAI